MAQCAADFQRSFWPLFLGGMRGWGLGTREMQKDADVDTKGLSKSRQDAKKNSRKGRNATAEVAE
jgi:hypothetical protein